MSKKKKVKFLISIAINRKKREKFVKIQMDKQTHANQRMTITISHLHPPVSTIVRIHEPSYNSPAHRPYVATIKPIHRLSLSLSLGYRGKNKRIDDISWIVRFLSRLDLRFAKNSKERERERNKERISPLRFNKRRRTIVRYDLIALITALLTCVFESRDTTSHN